MAVETEAADHDRVEVPCEEVGEVEGRRLGVVQLLPFGIPGEEPVAVGAGQALDVMTLEHAVEISARPAVGVPDEDALVATAELVQLRVDRGRDQLGAGMELRGETADGHVAPAVELDDGEHLAGDRAAREDEHLGALGLEDALLVRTQ